MNSHSPVVLSALRREPLQSQILFADMVSVSDPRARHVRRKTRIRPVAPSGQGSLAGMKSGGPVGQFEVERFLETVICGERPET